jgi:outer membrane protein assembly factor BamB
MRGGVVFAATAEGWFIALDSKTGKLLWEFYTGGAISASPMSYSVGGEQYVVVAAGHTVYGMALPHCRSNFGGLNRYRVSLRREASCARP